MAFMFFWGLGVGEIQIIPWSSKRILSSGIQHSPMSRPIEGIPWDYEQFHRFSACIARRYQLVSVLVPAPKSLPKRRRRSGEKAHPL